MPARGCNSIFPSPCRRFKSQCSKDDANDFEARLTLNDCSPPVVRAGIADALSLAGCAGGHDAGLLLVAETTSGAEEAASVSDARTHRVLIATTRARDERPGAMLADWELIGVPHRVTIGDKGLKDGQVEYQHRRDAAATRVPVADIAAHVRGRLAA